MIGLAEKLLGAINWPTLVFGFFNQLRKRSKGGRLGPMVRLRIKRIDKGGRYMLDEVTGHLHRHGVPTFRHTYDDTYRYFWVRRTQVDWTKWLVNGEELRTPNTRWQP